MCAEARTDLYQTHTLIQLYLAGLQILLDPSDAPSFARLRHLLEESGQQIPEAEQRNLYFLLLNVCIKRLNQGEAEAGTAIFEIYGSLLSRELLLENGYLAPGHFKNVVAIGVRLREFERTERFIESYHLQLPPAEHESVYAYNQAYLAFSRGEYRQVLRLLRRSEWNDLYYQLDARVLLIKTYYEMGDFEGLEYDINSLRTFLRRNRRISAYQQRLFQHLVRAMQLFLRFYAGQERAEHLIQFLESHPDTAGLAWLKQKAQEIQT
ncbi:MAG: hypothetical protein EAZ89_11745 [Bacteroidetes bacterium]|nr:MAG: hypothetical protein EAZ89_11745 [Bacteroidota bacterium]